MKRRVDERTARDAKAGEGQAGYGCGPSAYSSEEEEQEIQRSGGGGGVRDDGHAGEFRIMWKGSGGRSFSWVPLERLVDERLRAEAAKYKARVKKKAAAVKAEAAEAHLAAKAKAVKAEEEAKALRFAKMEAEALAASDGDDDDESLVMRDDDEPLSTREEQVVVEAAVEAAVEAGGGCGGGAVEAAEAEAAAKMVKQAAAKALCRRKSFEGAFPHTNPSSVTPLALVPFVPPSAPLKVRGRRRRRRRQRRDARARRRGGDGGCAGVRRDSDRAGGRLVGRAHVGPMQPLEETWRALGGVAAEDLPDEWFCEMNDDVAYASCGVAEARRGQGRGGARTMANVTVTEVYDHYIFGGATPGSLYRLASVGSPTARRRQTARARRVRRRHCRTRRRTSRPSAARRWRGNRRPSTSAVTSSCLRR